MQKNIKVDKSLETWTKSINAICPGPSLDEVVKMLWNNEWRYYKYRAYSNSNGLMWDRVTKKHYDDFLQQIQTNKHLNVKGIFKAHK